MATPHTVADKQLIRQEIKDARQRGYAFTDRQSIREEVNVAAAILDANRRPLGAIVVSAPVKNWSIERLNRVVAPLLLSHARSGGF
ncbi:transcriptional repressor IclR [compost metagenome]